ncbi:uncharacterized protein [Epargyreus clarus]|uniref:uncharacterized protein n=1 Tax=Epargyreus clarus TaxID=520877 RepID=UPI003C2DD51F
MSEYSSPNLCIVQLITKGRKLFFISVYIEPRTDEHNTLNRLEMFLKANHKAHIIIGGDFNGWHPSWGSPKSNKRGKDVNNLISSYDLVLGNSGTTPTYATITHGTYRSSIIDLTLYSDNIANRVLDWQVNTNACPSSEHEAIEFSINIGNIKLSRKKKQSTYKYTTNDADWESFKNNLKNAMEENRIKEIAIESLNEHQLDIYINTVTNTIQKACDKSFRRKPLSNKRIPWWNSELDNLKKEVVKMHHRIQDLVRSGKSIQHAIAERKELKEQYALCIRKTSTEHFRQFCSMQGKENVWSLTNRLLKNAPQPTPCLTVSTGKKLICKRLTYHLDKYEYSNPLQFGFKEQTSTTDALSKAIERISEAKSNKHLVIAISLDIQAAFDNAWWPMIFKRLKHIQCPKNLYSLILNYIKDRKVSLNYADVTVSKNMSRGCIQGSVCGPMFWNLILDDLFDVKLPQGCHMQAFADDVLLIINSKKVGELEVIANKALESIVKWGTEVKLNFGPNKTQIITFTPKAKAAKIKFNGIELQYVNEIKVLGVIIDKNLNFINHVKYIINKSTIIYKKLAIFARPTWGTQPENIKIIYKQVIEPIVTYAAGIWGSATKYETVKNQLRSLQRGFAIKIIRAFRTVSATAAIALAGLTPLHLKIDEVAALEIAKAVGTSPLFPDDLTIEKPIRNRELLHPADRKFIEFEYADNQDDIDKFCSSDCTLIFTDGSKHSEDKVGAAFVAHRPNSAKIVKKFKLHGSSSVYQAELLAIQNACSWVKLNKINDSAILSDSLSSLYEIRNKDSNNEAVVAIHKCIKDINDNNGKILFIWVKAHTVDTPDYLPIQKSMRLKAATFPTTPNEVDFTLEEVRDCMLSMSPQKAPGPDNLTADICSKFMATFPETYGFREQKSTNDALAEALKRVNDAKRGGNLVIGISLDIKGAFDHAWWPALMNRANSMNSFLQMRPIYIRMEADMTVPLVPLTLYTNPTELL